MKSRRASRRAEARRLNTATTSRRLLARLRLHLSLGELVDVQTLHVSQPLRQQREHHAHRRLADTLTRLIRIHTLLDELEQREHRSGADRVEVVVPTVAWKGADTLLEQVLDRVDLLLLHLRRQADQLLERQPIQAVGLGVEEGSGDELGHLVVVSHAGADRRQLRLLLTDTRRRAVGLASQQAERPGDEAPDARQVGRVVPVVTLGAFRHFALPGDALGVCARLGSRVVDRVLRVSRVAHERRDRRLPRTDPRAILRVRLELDADLAVPGLHHLVGRPHAQNVVDLVHAADGDLSHGADVVDEALLEGARAAGAHAPVIGVELRQLPHEHHRPELVGRHLLRTDHDDRLIEDELLVLHGRGDGARDQLGVGLHEPDDDTLQQVSRLVHVDAVDQGQHLDQVPRDEGQVTTPRPERTVVHRDDRRTTVEGADQDRQHHVTDRHVDGRDDLVDVTLGVDLVEPQVAGEAQKEIALDHRPHQNQRVLQLRIERLAEAGRPHLNRRKDGRQLVADELQRTLVQLTRRSLGIALLQLGHHLGQGSDDLLLSRLELGVEGVGDLPVLGGEHLLVVSEHPVVFREEGVDRLREKTVDHDVGHVVGEQTLRGDLRRRRVGLDEVDDARHRDVERLRVELAEHAQVDAVAALGIGHVGEREVRRVGVRHGALHEFVDRGEGVVLLAAADEERVATEQALLRAGTVGQVVDAGRNDLEDGAAVVGVVAGVHSHSPFGLVKKKQCGSRRHQQRAVGAGSFVGASRIRDSAQRMTNLCRTCAAEKLDERL